jgi:ankyrin repeat protein
MHEMLLVHFPDQHIWKETLTQSKLGGAVMDAKFHPAMAAISSGDFQGLRELVGLDPTLATSRSSTSHPTLLQCLVLSGKNVSTKLDMAKLLIDSGAELHGPLVACGSCDNVEVAELLIDSGAAINVERGWLPLEEALYWNSRRVIDLLLRRGAAIQNLRIAAGLGRTDLIENFFNRDGSIKPEAGRINWPWGDLSVIEKSNFDSAGRQRLAARFNSWTNDRQNIVDNAFVYACMHGHIEAANLLLSKGAQINAIPGGFDYAGTGLHYAALNGHQPMVDWLVQHGADTRIKDEKVGGTPASWAEYGGHAQVRDFLKARET